MVPEIFLPVGALFFGHHQVHRPQDRRRRVDGHRDRRLLQSDSVEEDLHVLQRVDGDAAFADLAFAEGMIAVVAHQRGQVEGHGQASGRHAPADTCNARWSLPGEAKPENWRMVQSLPR